MIRPPDGPGRWALAGAALIWACVVAGRVAGGWALGAAVAVGIGLVVFARRPWAVVLSSLLVAGSISGALSAARTSAVLDAPVAEGPVRVAGTALEDSRRGASGDWFMFRPSHVSDAGTWKAWAGPPMLVSLREPVEVAAGDRIIVNGVSVSSPGMARGDPYAGVIRRARVVETGSASSILFRVGNAIRDRIAAGIPEGSPAGALLSGFLIGDVRDLPPVSADQLRRAGLTHFVAVSGSNVALFLILWWVVVGPFAFGPRRRAIAGLVGLAVFVVVTRWEPSVLRAAGMAGLLLVARASGVALTPWVALGTSVGGLLLVSGELSGDVGFQLSVAATAGVMAGANMFENRLPRLIGAPLGATIAAQVAVAPILLAHFGTIPLLSPIANLIASPLVMVSTATGGIGLLAGIGPLTSVAIFAANGVIAIAKVASGWPQLGPVAATGAISGSLLAASKRLRPVLTVIGAGVLLMSVVGHRIDTPSAVFLDVGQGDAELIIGSSGETILIDGGPDAALILRKLADYGVDHVDVMVLSHPHDDHATGLLAILEQLPVGVLWESGYQGGGPAAAELLAEARLRGVPVLTPTAGAVFGVGQFTIKAIGPLRSYASPNDQSLVLDIETLGTRMLFAGDVETIAQAELGTVRTDVLKVPHQGAATSDESWVASTGAREAIISVGPNTFGHPSESVIDALEAAGARVRRTDQEGDIIVAFGTTRS